MAEQRQGREGGKWINERPTSEEFAQWFSDSMKIDPILKVADYLGGVVLIPAVDSRAKYVTGFTNGVPVIEEREELIYTPYAKVETRIDYFWDLLAVHPEWLGVVEHVDSRRMPLDLVTVEEREQVGLTEGGEPRERTINRQIRQPGAMTALAHVLPEGFSIMSVPVGQGYSHFLCCTTRVSIYDREQYKELGKSAVPLRTGRGTKQVPLLLGRREPYADSSSLMKAETGSLGRALGFAGVFIIPGSGVATAEDMLEAIAQGTGGPAPQAAEGQGPATPAAPPVRTPAEQSQDEEGELRKRAATLYKALSEEHPGRAEEFGSWMQQRRISRFSDARGAALRGVVKKLEKLSEQAAQTSQQGAPETTEDKPQESSDGSTEASETSDVSEENLSGGADSGDS